MECNKDEAIRAKEIAEKKMEKNDFEGARKIALKAQNLYPELDNITQLLSICDVHCSAQSRLLGSDKDWYGILQVERLADELTVKKQYRRLALILHPDKNRFPGAESAFKLICEAYAVLSDSTKKSLYDSKVRVSVRSAQVNPPPHAANKNSQVKKQYTAQNMSNGFSSLNQHQATRSTPSVGQEVFWTCCPYCSVRYQYLRQFVNKSLRCQTCTKVFVGYEIGTQGVSLGSKMGQPVPQSVPSKPGSSQPAFQEKGFANQGKNKMGVQSSKASSASSAGSQGFANRKTVQPDPGVRMGRGSEGTQVGSAAQVSGDLKTKEADSHNANPLQGRKEAGISNGDAINGEKGDLKNKSRKRSRKLVVESSESYDTSSQSDEEDVTMKGNSNDTDLKPDPNHVQPSRRSSRKRQHVSYKEPDEDALARSLKREQPAKEDNGKEQMDALDGEDPKHDNQKSSPTDADYSKQESLQRKDAGYDKKDKKVRTGGESSAGADTVEIESDSDRDSFSGNKSEAGLCYCPDPEFSDFEKERDESRFNVNQFWACYDTLDGMPRFYAKVKKVCSSPFELSITWLEADPIDDVYEKWVDEELPVGCGRFKLGKTEETSIRLSFSHQVHCEKGKKRGSLIIYPREGEVWALFRDWDISWSSNPENYKEFKYEIVEVLSDFDAGTGIKVGYLDKVTGFVSLFQRVSQSETNSFLIRPNELYKFSHRVPCFRMTGSERQGVPIGSFELDPASLPSNPDDLYYPGKAKTECRNIDHGVNCPLPESTKEKGKSVESKGKSTPKKSADSEGINVDISKLRRSPRGLNVVRQTAN
ncbi:DnaJsubfamily B member 5 [Sesamum alatum]|uniref:DnaJsubfamily B member 5 n=1 Tax=Sesamum alatum TaxID=300844 RepID=A0AAE1XQM5_9LAMI|nr:DnaJsubfamily B member 5 [Sesamum alatum]